jgi:hypothetical protein
MVFSIEYRLKKEKEKISKLSFIISLFYKISKNPSLIIYADLKITTLNKKRGICFKK